MQASDHPPIIDLFLRGNYPNKRDIVNSMACHLLRKRPTPLKAKTDPLLEVYRQGRELPEECAVKDMDIPFLCQRKRKKAFGYAELLLRAKKGDRLAKRKVEETARDYFEEKRSYFRNIPESGDDHVVPCTSTDEYPETVVSNKGSTLLKLSQQGYSVPDFVILTSRVYPCEKHLRLKHIESSIQYLERLTAQSIASPEDHLVFAIRCAMPSYMPGVMPTYLNVGITETSYPALKSYFGKAVAQRIMLNNLKNMLMILDRASYHKITSPEHPNLRSIPQQLEYAFDRIRSLNPRLLEDPYYQTAFFVQQAYSYFENNTDLMLTFSKGEKNYPSIIIQKMVCTVRHPNSRVGILFSRHQRTGEGMQMESARDVFGEEIMAGLVDTEVTSFAEPEQIRSEFPSVHHFLPHLKNLEAEFQSPVTIEFATDDTDRHSFYALLQLNASEVTGRSAFISTIDLYREGTIPLTRVPELIKPYHIKQIESDAIDPDSLLDLKPFSRGASILPRTAVSAQMYFSSRAALKAKRAGSKVCFCKPSFSPADIAVLREMDAICGLASSAIHVVTICQSYGLPALLNLGKHGVHFSEPGHLFNNAGSMICAGDWVTISSRGQCLYLGQARFKPARLLRHMAGEKVELEEVEKASFAKMERAYREYNDLIVNLKLNQISSLQDIIRFVILEYRGETEKAGLLVNEWFDQNRMLYVEEVFNSDMGDHLKQHTVFNLLTLDRKITFFKMAVAKCLEEKKSGYTAGAFMLGRFICLTQPIAFWKSLSPREISILIHEWLLFEKYMQLLSFMGEDRITRAKDKILKEGLDSIRLTPKKIKAFITLKLSGVPLLDIKDSVPAWCDPQTGGVLELLAGTYSRFYAFDSPWSVQELKDICLRESLPLPSPEDR